MAKRDYYEVLGVAKNASADDLKRNYRKLAMEFHPDRNAGNAEAEQKFKEISEAYEVLKDADKRAAYDRMGHAAFEGGHGGGNGFGFDFAHGFADVFDELFGDFMGQGRGGPRGRGGAQRGADLRYNLEITLEEAFGGAKKQIKVPSMDLCEGCQGSGAADGAKPITCATCRGTGKLRQQQGFFTLERTCPTCHGQGSAIDKPCTKCHGVGRVKREKTLAVQIPAGVEDGTRIRLANEGEPGARGGPPGDLYIFLAIQPHRLFQREGAHIYCKVPISMVNAALGGEIEVPCIDGQTARVTIPPGSQTGRQFRLRGKGMSVMRGGGFGDMYIQAMVETPVNLTERQRELLKEFEAAGANTSPESAGFFSKVKEFWGSL